MPIENNKPPDPLLAEFKELTGLTADGAYEVSVGNTKVGDSIGKHHKHRHGIKIKVSSPGSAGAGSILKRLRSSKVAGKAHGRFDDSQEDCRGGKRFDSLPVDDTINRVLRDLKSGPLNDSLRFSVGSNYVNPGVCLPVSEGDGVNGNDGSFINCPSVVNPVVIDQLESEAKCSGPLGGLKRPGMDAGGNTGGVKTNLVGGFNDAKSDMVIDEGTTIPKDRCDLTSMEDVVSTGNAQPIGMDGSTIINVSRGFEFGKNNGTDGLLQKPVIPPFSVQFDRNENSNPFVGKSSVNPNSVWNAVKGNKFGPSLFYKNGFNNVWTPKSKAVNADGSINVDSFAEKIKKGMEDRELQMEFIPQAVSKMEDGTKRIMFSKEDIKAGSEACSLQLYGYFVGTSMDYRVVNGNLSRMWRMYGIESITKTNSGVFYFKFKNEEGMKSVLESGPWMVNNIPLVLNIWEPGIWLEKVEPSTIPIWVCVYNVPMELCNGNGISKIMSGVGKPMLMDKMTRERCLSKSGKLDFTRVLVEVSAEEELPHVLEIAYPAMGNKPARVGRLAVKYQWQPPLCTHCKTFGHSTCACKLRPRSDEELASKVDNGSGGGIKKTQEVEDCNDGFVTVGKKNKPVKEQSNLAQNLPYQRNKFFGNQSQGRGTQFGNKGNGGQGRGRPGQNFHNKVGNSMYVKGKKNENGNDIGKSSSKDPRALKDSMPKGSFKPVNANLNSAKKPVNVVPLDQSSFRPRVLVRGGASNSNHCNAVEEKIPVANSFQALEELSSKKEVTGEVAMDAENGSDIEPRLKQEVIEIMSKGVYPSADIRMNWLPSQVSFFYNNCFSYGMDPSVEDDDIESEHGGMADEMRPEILVGDGQIKGNEAIGTDMVSND